MYKKISLALLLSIFIVTPVFAYSNNNSIYTENLIAKEVYVGGEGDYEINSSSNFFQSLNTSTLVQDKNNSDNYVNLRNATELFGYKIEWNQKKMTATVVKKDENYTVKIGNSGITINDEKTGTSQKAVLINSSTYIPMEMYDIIFKDELKMLTNKSFYKISFEILGKLEKFYANQLKSNKEYKDAFISTGGDIADYINPVYSIGYEVINSSDILSVKVYHLQALASSFTEEIYLNYNNKTYAPITLTDVLGKNYEDALREDILTMMKEREAQSPDLYSYWYDDFEKAKLDNSRPFYFNKEGNLVIVFNKYEICAGVYGKQEFVITNNEKANTFKNNLSKNYYSERYNSFKNYLDLFDFKNMYNLLGYTNTEVLNLFSSPEFIFVKDTKSSEDREFVYIYKASNEDSIGIYINFTNNKVSSYKIDEFNGVYTFE
ncbi:MAG: stalk domain-containing protein [Lachnospirales bacterium]